jgi:hypothetical protein
MYNRAVINFLWGNHKMNKNLGLVLLFFASVMVSIAYQNCGGSTIKANSSDNNGLQVEVLPGDNNNNNQSGDGSSDTNNPGSFSFNLGNGDSIFYVDGGGLSLNLRTGKLLSQLYYTILESQIFEPRNGAIANELSTHYCSNSAFAHCRHLNSSGCVGIGCNQAVRCHSQVRLKTVDINSIFQKINNLRFANRIVTPTDPMIADCENPKLYFDSEKNKLELSLANKACVSNGNYYAIQGGDDIKSIFNTELDDINSLGNFCNNYSVYSWNTTKWFYKASTGGNTPSLQRQFREVYYENAKVKIKWKDAGTAEILCANDVFVNPPGIDIFFPSLGLDYQMYRTSIHSSDASTAEITYEDPVDGGDVRHFYLNNLTAENYAGGAVLSNVQGQAIKDHIEVLIARAKSQNFLVTCPAAN